MSRRLLDVANFALGHMARQAEPAPLIFGPLTTAEQALLPDIGIRQVSA